MMVLEVSRRSARKEKTTLTDYISCYKTAQRFTQFVFPIIDSNDAREIFSSPLLLAKSSQIFGSSTNDSFDVSH